MGRKIIRVQSAMTQMESDSTSLILASSSALDRVRTTHDDAWHKIIHKRSSWKKQKKYWYLSKIVGNWKLFYWVRITNSQRHVLFCILISQMLKFRKTQLETGEPCFSKINKQIFFQEVLNISCKYAICLMRQQSSPAQQLVVANYISWWEQQKFQCCRHYTCYDIQFIADMVYGNDAPLWWWLL